MNKGITTACWFDQWVKQAKHRTMRRRQVEAIVRMITGALIIAGLGMVFIGCAWIDSMDVCAANVTLAFAGVALCFAGTYTRYLVEAGI